MPEQGLALTKRAEFNLTPRSIEGASWATHRRRNLLGLFDGGQSIRFDGHHVLFQRDGTVHVLLGIVEQTHTVLRIAEAFRGCGAHQTRGLIDATSLCFELKQPVLQGIKSGFEPLPQGPLLVFNKPRPQRYAAREKGDARSSKVVVGPNVGAQAEPQRGHRHRTRAGEQGTIAGLAEATCEGIGCGAVEQCTDEDQGRSCRQALFDSRVAGA